MNRRLILVIVTSSALALLALALALIAQAAILPLELAPILTPNDFYAWGLVVQPGFGDPQNQRINTFGEFNGQLYAGTSNPGGAQIWRSSDGVSWTLASTVNSQTVATFGFHILQLTAFEGYLYASTSACGCGWHVLRSSTGTDWTPAGPRDSDKVFTMMTAYSHTLYAVDASYSSNVPLWQTSDGLNWQTVTDTAFLSKSVYSQIIFKDFFYVAVGGDGTQLLRTNGLTWQAVVTHGFGITQNYSISSLGIFSNQLYAVTHNQTQNLQIWRSNDGLDWTQVVSGGLGNPPHNVGAGIQLIPFQDHLFLFSSFAGHDNEVWRSADGSIWELVEFDDWATNQALMALRPVTVFNKRLLASSGDSISVTHGFRLWSYLTHPYYLPLLTARS